MRLPRVRFTIRRLMVVVAIAALGLFLAPIFVKLKLVYDRPFSANLATTLVTPRNFGSGAIRPVLVGRPVSIQCQFDTSFRGRVPSGIPFEITIEIQLIDQQTRVVEETHRRSRYVLSGEGVSRAELDVNLTPRHAGLYRVRYAGTSRDLFGRQGQTGGVDTRYLEAR